MSSATVGVTAHPAADAWGRMGQGVEPVAVDTIKQRGGTEVVQLVGAGPDGSNVIAKRCAGTVAVRELVVYERVLERLALPTLRFYGHLEVGTSTWLFLEQAGGDLYDPVSAEHRALAGRWLAAFHKASAGRDVARLLPARDERYYRRVVARARAVLSDSLRNPAIGSDDAGVVGELIACCSCLLGSWEAQAAALRALPATVVHNDFWSGNVRVRLVPGQRAQTNGAPSDRAPNDRAQSHRAPSHRAPSRLALLPFDWGAAGWGSPAVDLAAVDLDVYREATPALGCGVAQLACAVAVGRALRVLGTIPGEAENLASPWPERALRKLRVYAGELADADVLRRA